MDWICYSYYLLHWNYYFPFSLQDAFSDTLVERTLEQAEEGERAPGYANHEF